MAGNDCFLSLFHVFCARYFLPFSPRVANLTLRTARMCPRTTTEKGKNWIKLYKSELKLQINFYYYALSFLAFPSPQIRTVNLKTDKRKEHRRERRKDEEKGIKVEDSVNNGKNIVDQKLKQCWGQEWVKWALVSLYDDYKFCLVFKGRRNQTSSRDPALKEVSGVEEFFASLNV